MSVRSNDEVDAAWEAEVACRIQQIDSGEVECILKLKEKPRLRATLKKLAGDSRALSTGRRQTPSEDLLRESRDER